MGNYNFRKDLAKAKKCEERVAEYLKKTGSTDITFNDNSQYDIQYKRGTFLLTLEVKEDMMYEKTGNIAIEISSRAKPSGICTSIADNWCYVLGNDLYFCKRSELLENLLLNPYRKVPGGDDLTSVLVLVPVRKFAEICDIIKDAV